MNIAERTAKLRAALAELKALNRAKVAPANVRTELKVSKNAFAVVWSNSYQDRDGEWFSEKALDDYVTRTEKGEAELPELWIWHTPGTRIGKAEFVARDGHFMLAGGEFDQSPLAQKAKAYYAAHIDEIGASHGYTYLTEDLKDKTYHKIQSVQEISLLPRLHVANRGTALIGVKGAASDAKKRQHLIDMFGEEEADRILANLASVGEALEAQGIEHKSKAAAMVQISKDGWYPTGEFAAAKQKERELIAAVTAEAKKQAGVYIDPFFGTEVYPQAEKEVVEVELDPFWRLPVTKNKAAQKVVVNHKMFGRLAFPITRKKQYGDLELMDAIDAMQRALELPEAVVVEMIRKNGYQGTYDMLKASIEAAGGTVTFNLEVKK